MNPLMERELAAHVLFSSGNKGPGRDGLQAFFPLEHSAQATKFMGGMKSTRNTDDGDEPTPLPCCKQIEVQS